MLTATRRVSGIKPGLVQSKISTFLQKFPGLAKAEPKIKLNFNQETGASGAEERPSVANKKRKLCFLGGCGGGGVDQVYSPATSKRIRHQ